MTLPSIVLRGETLANFEEALTKEWLITNGLGGYASSSVPDVNTRKYHGLLVAALRPPNGRMVCLAKLDEDIILGNETCRLGANKFQNAIFPQGHKFLREFSLSPFPKHVYEVRSVQLCKTVLMPYEKNAVVIAYEVFNNGDREATVRVYPIVNWRNIHTVTDRWKIHWEFSQEHENRTVDIRAGKSESVLSLQATSGRYYTTGNWVEKLFYGEEARRGESSLDDCYQPGHFDVDVKPRGHAGFAVLAVAGEREYEARKTLNGLPVTTHDVEALQEQESSRRENLLTSFFEQKLNVTTTDWLSWIILATDSFLIRGVDKEQRAVVAGYHWFECWGRDTFISLPGIALVTGRFEEARKVFLTFQRHVKDGLIPNYLSNSSELVAYNTVDATLWFVNAVLQYVKYTGDFKFVRDRLWQTLKAIIDNHKKGTSFGIRMDVDGLLVHGPQLTWMDAAVDGQAITPRDGKAVEIQALWSNALKVMSVLASKFDENREAENYSVIADRTKKSFGEKFWDAGRGFLCDVLKENRRDGSFRPNQVLAVALDFTLLDAARSEKVVDLVQHELLTPCGLRTLERKDPRYVGAYAGDRLSRDRAYHNGTVWPWLLGPLATAYLKTKGYAESRREYALRSFLQPLFIGQVFRAGLGTVGEIFDGDPPHTPRGCIAQAWSVAEPLRAYVEDVAQNRPRYERDVLKGLW